MKYRFFNIVSFIIALSILSVGCKKSLEIEPRQSIEAATALTTRDNVNAAITGVYSRLKSARMYGRDLIALPEALADNGFATNKSGRLVGEANNLAGSHFSQFTWQISYFAINEINLILAAVPNIPDATATDKASWEGQLSFLRALLYFNLVNIYGYMPGATVPSQDRGGVPIILTGTQATGEAQVLLPRRSSVDSVYNQIVKDFETANARFSISGPTDVNLATKTGAQALLSRVNLYRKNYTEARRWADSAIARKPQLSDATSYVTHWRQATHPETIFQVRYALPSENIGVNESLQTSFTTLVEIGNRGRTGGFGDLVPTLTLLSDLGITIGTRNASTGAVTAAHNTTTFALASLDIASRSADIRNQLYEVGTPGRGPNKVETTKYLGKNGAVNLDNVPVIRIAEVYLNRAEAFATPGSAVFDEAAALADLNRLVTNRGLPAFTGLTGSQLYEEILRQRRIELAFEGHRFWDLKRLGRDLVKTPHYNTVAFTDFRILAPLPQREVDGNPNLRQNFNY